MATSRRVAAVRKASEEEVARSATDRAAKSRHGWLLALNALSIGIGWLALASGGPNLLNGTAHLDNGNYSPLWLIFDAFAALAPIWSLMASGGFRRGTIGRKSPLERGFYWVTAAPGLLVFLVGVVAPLVVYLVEIVVGVIAVGLAFRSEAEHAQLMGVARQAADEALRKRR